MVWTGQPPNDQGVVDCFGLYSRIRFSYPPTGHIWYHRCRLDSIAAPVVAGTGRTSISTGPGPYISVTLVVGTLGFIVASQPGFGGRLCLAFLAACPTAHQFQCAWVAASSRPARWVFSSSACCTGWIFERPEGLTCRCRLFNWNSWWRGNPCCQRNPLAMGVVGDIDVLWRSGPIKQCFAGGA